MHVGRNAVAFFVRFEQRAECVHVTFVILVDRVSGRVRRALDANRLADHRVDRMSIRHPAERVLEYAAAVHDWWRERRQTFPAVLKGAHSTARWVIGLLIEVVFSE